MSERERERERGTSEQERDGIGQRAGGEPVVDRVQHLRARASLGGGAAGAFRRCCCFTPFRQFCARAHTTKAPGRSLLCDGVPCPARAGVQSGSSAAVGRQETVGARRCAQVRGEADQRVACGDGDTHPHRRRGEDGCRRGRRRWAERIRFVPLFGGHPELAGMYAPSSKCGRRGERPGTRRRRMNQHAPIYGKLLLRLKRRAEAEMVKYRIAR